MERESFPSNVGVMTPEGEFKPIRQPSLISAISKVEDNVETWAQLPARTCTIRADGRPLGS